MGTFVNPARYEARSSGVQTGDDSTHSRLLQLNEDNFEVYIGVTLENPQVYSTYSTQNYRLTGACEILSYRVPGFTGCPRSVRGLNGESRNVQLGLNVPVASKQTRMLG